MLNPNDIAAMLDKTKRLGKPARCYDETESTNLVARDWAMKGAPEGALVTAELQTNGKGRGGKTWLSNKGENLMFTLVLRPTVDARRLPLLSLLAADAVAETTTEILSKINGVRASIKYPNDVMVNEKKISGVLLESRIGESVEFVLLGIGLNVNQIEFDESVSATATSLKQLTNTTFERATVLKKIIEKLDGKYDAFLRGDDEQLIQSWREKCATLGQDIRFELNGIPTEGKAISIDQFGRLEIKTAEQTLFVAPSEIAYIRPKHA